MKYNGVSISADAVKVLSNMKQCGMKLMPWYNRSGRCNRYVIEGNHLRKVSQLSLTMKQRLAQLRLICPDDNGLKWSLDDERYGKFVAEIQRRQKARERFANAK